MSAIRQRISVFLLAAGCWCGMSPSCGVAQSSYTGGSFSTVLPTSWKTLNAVEPVGNVVYVGGSGDGGAKLGVYDATAGKFSDLSNVLPASWCQGIRTISCGDNMLLIGGQGPSRVGTYSLTSQSFQDLTSKLTDYHYGLNAAAFNGSQFLIGGAGFNTSIQLVSPSGQFTSLAPKIPFYFAVNTAVQVGGSIFIAGAGPGPGPGQPPAFGSVAADGSFNNLTGSLPSGWGASWHSAYNGSVVFLQGFDSASGAHQLLALFNPTSKAATDVTASFPASFQLHGSGGGNGNFLIGGQLNGSAYLALYTSGSEPTIFTSVLPAGAQDVTAIKIAGSGFVGGGINKDGQIFLVGGPITTTTTSSIGILAPSSESQQQQNALVVRDVSILVPNKKYALTLGTQSLASQNNAHPTDSTRTDIGPSLPTGLLYSYGTLTQPWTQPFQGAQVAISFTVENTGDVALTPPTLVIANTDPAVDAQGHQPQPQLPIQPSDTQSIPPHTKSGLHYQFTPTWNEFKQGADVQTLLLGSQVSSSGSTIADATKYIAQTSTVADKLGNLSSFLDVADNLLNVAASLSALETKIAVKQVTYSLQLQGNGYTVADGTSTGSLQAYLYPLEVCWQPPKNDILDAYVISAWYEAIVGPVSTGAGLAAGAGAVATGAGAPAAPLVDAGAAIAVQAVAMKLEPSIAKATGASSDVAQILTAYPDYSADWYSTTLQQDLTWSKSVSLGYTDAGLQSACPLGTSTANNAQSISSESPFTSHTITPSEPSTPLPPTTPHFP